MRRTAPVEDSQNAFVDFLGFTVKSEKPEVLRAFVLWMIRQLVGDLPVTDKGRGWSGYGTRLDFPGGLAAYGGNSDTAHFELTGEGCARVRNWNDLADTLDDLQAKITRCDVAHDDFEGDYLSISWGLEQHRTSGFKPSRGVSPRAHLHDDLGSGKGSTLYVGSRGSGKLCRIYEKGKQLGDPASKWVRAEVEYRAVHRELPVQMLRDPSAYLAGSYPCMGQISGRQQVIKTVAFNAAASVEKALKHAKQQAGGLVAALKVLGYSTKQIMSEISKAAPSDRLLPLVGIIKAHRKQKQQQGAPSWWRAPTVEDAERTRRMLALDFSFWRDRSSGAAYA